MAPRKSLQTILVPKNRFSEKEAISWINSRRYKDNRKDETVAHYRFHQKEPTKKREYETVLLPNWVLLVYTK